ncbi:MAG TPA: LPS export ABC transporter periplasmic protein LptC [Anaeromyxobacteraceae bacterium]
MVTRFSASLAALTFLALSSGCGVANQQGNEEVPPELTFDNFRFRVYRGPVLTAEGDAVHASFRRDTADLAADRIRLRIPATATRAEARITAARGSGNVKDRRFEASGGVRAEQGDQVATTAQARYTAADRLVHGDQPVEVRSGSLTVRGPGFTLEPDDQVLRIEGGAHVVAGPARAEAAR